MVPPGLIILVYFSLSLLSLTISLLLMYKYLKDTKKNYRIYAITKALSFLTFFIFVDGLYYAIMFSAQYNLFPLSVFITLSNPAMQVLTKLGIFISTVFIVYFIFNKNIEVLKDREANFARLQQYNKELQRRAHELEASQGSLKRKVWELERFNEIAQSRELKMIDLIKKIEYLESKMRKKE